MRWVDNHCHLPPGADGDPLVAAARAAGVDTMITVGTSADRSREAASVAARHDGVFATAGVHPHDATEGIEAIAGLVADGSFVAVGEAGLDFHYDHSPRAVQRDVFAAQIGLANAHDLPLVIHTREAWPETFEILDREGMPRRTVFHCFTGGPDEAAAGVVRGAMLSISGIVTFKTAADLRDAVAATPLDRLMVETDSPYLAPVPHRGKKNRPEFVALVGEKVAELHGVSVATVASATTAAAHRFYGLDAVVR